MRLISASPKGAPVGYCPACGYSIDAGRCPECGADVVQPLQHNPHVFWRRWRSHLILLAIGLALVLGGRPAFEWIAVEFWPGGQLRELAESDSRFANWAERVLERRALQVDRQELPRSVERAGQIAAELAGSGPREDWAGVYDSSGPGGGGTLALAPRAGFVERHFESFDHGTVVESAAGRLRLHGCRAHRLGLKSHADFVRVRWGQRRMLVCTQEMPGFCRYLNGGELHGEHVYVHHQDAPKPCGPKAEVPAEYQALVQPLRSASVLLIGPTQEMLVETAADVGVVYYSYNCVIDKGDDDDVCVGQSARALFGSLDSCDVIETDEHASVLNCHGTFPLEDAAPVYAPAPGWFFALLDQPPDPNPLTAPSQLSLDDDADSNEPPSS